MKIKLSPAVSHTPGYMPWLNFAIGALTFGSAWYDTSFQSNVRMNIAITGAVLVIASLASLVSRLARRPDVWPAVNFFAGIWLIMSTPMTGTKPVDVWSEFGLGVSAVLIAAVGVLSDSA